MKNIFSFIVCLITGVVLLIYRIDNSDICTKQALKITIWDANGYYLYLPAIAIYKDYKELKWLEAIDKKYAVTGGDGYQAQKTENGNYVFKYLGGVALMEIPFFYSGHFFAKMYHYPQDGFSPPYQYALGFGIILYCILAIFLLRKILLLYFQDFIVAFTLLLLCLATNFIQYAAVDSGQTHAYLFVLYVLVVYFTIKWHQKPQFIWAALTGFIIGLATMTRPTEAIMLFIPLLWGTATKETAKQKWLLVKQNKIHIGIICLFGFLGVLPQLIYWKLSTGSFIYDVGSKWEFLSPHFRVLFGWEKGWFIYTPITLFFIIGMFYLKKFPFKKSVLWFCILNIYIIIAWHDWRYGGSYSTRALVQSYPLFSLPLAAVIEKLSINKWKYLFYPVFLYLLFVNLFQTNQYCKTILHYNDMNRMYYGRIYLNPNPTPLDMSFLDNDEMIDDINKYRQKCIVYRENKQNIDTKNNGKGILFDSTIEKVRDSYLYTWLRINATIKAPNHLWQSYINAELRNKDSIKTYKIRLFNALTKEEQSNNYEFYMKIPLTFDTSRLTLYISSQGNFTGKIEKLNITKYEYIYTK